MNALGRHLLIDYYDCDAEILKEPGGIREILLRAVRRSGATIVTDNFHAFEPYGVSGVVVIAESHVTIHTWPEHAYAAVDVFTCGDTMRCETVQSEIQDALSAGRVSSHAIDRGRALCHVPTS